MAYSFVGAASNTATSGASASVTHGLTITDDDLVVVFVHTNNSAATIADTTGSGATFSTAYSNVAPSGETATYSYFYKNAASEPATYTFSHGGSARWGVIIMVFTPGTGTSVLDAQTNGQVSSTNSPAVPGITTANNSVAVICTGRDRSDSNAVSPDNSYLSLTQANNQRCNMTYRLFATGAATGTTTLSTYGVNDVEYYAHVSFKEDAGGGATNPKGPLGHPLHGPLAGPIGP